MIFREALIELDITQREAASLFGIAERTARHYANETSPVPVPIRILLGLLLDGDLVIVNNKIVAKPRKGRR